MSGAQEESSRSAFSEIVNALRGEGYKIANCMGFEELPADKTHAGILKPRKPAERKIFFGWVKRKTGALFIGVLWLNNEARGAEVDKQWILEVHGKDYAEELTKLVNRIAEPYKVDVVVNLESDQPRLERFYSEYHML
jgi:hypothetical protein